MIIFLRNIPALTGKREITEFIEPALKTILFGKKGTIESIKVIQLKNSRTKISEFHSLVTIEPEAAAKKVIKRLNKKKFINRHIEVREYRQRDWHNDPRLNYDQSISGKSGKSEKRLFDRRRKEMEVIMAIKSEFSSNRVFHRSF